MFMGLAVFIKSFQENQSHISFENRCDIIQKPSVKCYERLLSPRHYCEADEFNNLLIWWRMTRSLLVRQNMISTSHIPEQKPTWHAIAAYCVFDISGCYRGQNLICDILF